METLEDRSVPSADYTFAALPFPPGSGASNYQTAFGINNAGDIVGGYRTSNITSHGYVYSRGQYRTLDQHPLAGRRGTSHTGINNAGDIAGAYYDANDRLHGFALSRGRYTTFDHPDASTGRFQGTYCWDNNDHGQIVGSYIDANDAPHGFLFSGGVYTTIDGPFADEGGTAQVFGINNAGDIVGFYSNADFSELGGFVLSHGQYTVINNPLYDQTTPTGINDRGQVVGYTVDADFNFHGFVYSAGQFTTVDYPDSAYTEYGYASLAWGINNRGQVVGQYYDANFIGHSYLATPAHGNSSAVWVGVLFAEPTRPTQTGNQTANAGSFHADSLARRFGLREIWVARPSVELPRGLTAAVSRQTRHARALDPGPDRLTSIDPGWEDEAVWSLD